MKIKQLRKTSLLIIMKVQKLTNYYIMTQLFTITSLPAFISTIPTSLPLTATTTVLINNFLLYPDASSKSLVVIDVAGSNILKKNTQLQEISIKQKNEKKYWQISMPKSIPHLQNITNLLTLPNNNENTPQRQIHQLILLTNSYICYIQLDNRLNKIITHTNYYLLYEPHSQIQILRANNTTDVKSLFNQQVMLLHMGETREKQKNQCILIVVGFDQNYRVVGNLYIINGSENMNSIELVTNFRIETPEKLKNIYECSFTLTQAHPNTPFIYLFPIFNQKSMPLCAYQYSLEHLLHLKQSQTTVIKSTQQYELFSFHNHYHTSAIHHEGEDLYICYTRYVPFKKNYKEEGQALSHVWVYNLSQGFTKNIIDLKGFTTSPKIMENRSNEGNIKTLWNISSCQKQGINCLNYIKMDSSTYHPKFQINTHTQQYLCQSEQYLITHTHQQKTLQPKYLSIYPKIKKKAIYCKMWQQLKLIESDNILQLIMGML